MLPRYINCHVEYNRINHVFRLFIAVFVVCCFQRFSSLLFVVRALPVRSFSWLSTNQGFRTGSHGSRLSNSFQLPAPQTCSVVFNRGGLRSLATDLLGCDNSCPPWWQTVVWREREDERKREIILAADWNELCFCVSLRQQSSEWHRLPSDVNCRTFSQFFFLLCRHHNRCRASEMFAMLLSNCTLSLRLIYSDFSLQIEPSLQSEALFTMLWIGLFCFYFVAL